MARATSNKLYRTFTKGLITEAGFLTYPENASIDEMNTVIKTKGSRSRRFGIDWEPDSEASTITGKADGDTTSSYSWKAVNNDPEVNFLVIQIAEFLHFYNLDSIPISGDKKSFTVDLTDYKVSTAADSDVQTSAVQMTSGKGFLFVAQEYIDPLVIEYDPDTDTISTEKLILRVRDFLGVDDELLADEQPTTLSKEHFYNLRNQGWIKPGPLGVLEGAGTADPYTAPADPSNTGLFFDFLRNAAQRSRADYTSVKDPITHYYNRMGRYPANNQQWWLARTDIEDTDRGVAEGDFVPEILAKTFLGTMRAPRGHFILNAFSKDRATASGINNLPVESIDERPPTVSFFSGRTWFACRSTVYFSQILTDKFKAAFCYMEADPTAEHISDPIATDGGTIEIPEANRIIRLIPYSEGLLVFANNGVWFISGTQDGFTALDISVTKLSPIGCYSPFSVVETDNAVFWWSEIGIMGLTRSEGGFSPVSGFSKVNVTEQTIQSFYNDISDDIRKEVIGLFDPKSNIIMWLYRCDEIAATQYNRVLLFDLTLQAFYPWQFSQLLSGPRIKGIFSSVRETSYELETDIKPLSIEFIVSNEEILRIAQIKSSRFTDWYSYNNEGIEYDSYVESGYELFDDAMRDKNITYIFTYLTRTETEASGDEADDPSSCKMRIKWDWASGSHSNKWTSEVEVYRPGPILFDNPDTGFGMVVTKHKVRGNGKAIQFRFGTDEAGKNFDLNGWSIAVSGNVSP